MFALHIPSTAAATTTKHSITHGISRQGSAGHHGLSHERDGRVATQRASAGHPARQHTRDRQDSSRCPLLALSAHQHRLRRPRRRQAISPRLNLPDPDLGANPRSSIHRRRPHPRPAGFRHGQRKMKDPQSCVRVRGDHELFLRCTQRQRCTIRSFPDPASGSHRCSAHRHGIKEGGEAQGRRPDTLH